MNIDDCYPNKPNTIPVLNQWFKINRNKSKEK